MRSGPAPGFDDVAARRAARAEARTAARRERMVRVEDPTWTNRVRATYLEVRAPLWRAVLAWSGDVDVADEAVAEAFAQLLRRGDDVLDPAAWVWRAAFRLAAGDLKRQRSVERRSTDPVALELVAGNVERLPDDALDLVEALQGLSEQQRRCIALVDVAGHTAPSAAEILGTTAATVRVQLMRGRRQLRSLLSDAPPEPQAPVAEVRPHPEMRT